MNDNVLADFGQAIRKIRTNAGISQEAFASKCELHRTYISDIELGKRNVSLENIQKMADALDMNISDVFLEMEKL